MNDHITTPDENPAETPVDNSAKQVPPTRQGSGMRALRTAIGTLLLGVMVGNLVVFAAPEWTGSLVNSLPASWTGEDCSSKGCGSGGCCSGLSPIGLPISVLEDSAERQQLEAAEKEKDTAEAK